MPSIKVILERKNDGEGKMAGSGRRMATLVWSSGQEEQVTGGKEEWEGRGQGLQRDKQKQPREWSETTKIDALPRVNKLWTRNKGGREGVQLDNSEFLVIWIAGWSKTWI